MDELGACRIIDVGCGTGELACRLARRGLSVIGVDPAAASLDVARSKLGADRVTWVHGTAADIPAALAAHELHRADAAVMTGNVAQVFLTDADWLATLGGVHDALATGGHLVFETRVPSFRAWDAWTADATREVMSTVEGRVEAWVHVTDDTPPFVTFDGVVRFDDGEEIRSTSTLRFRDRSEIEASVSAAGFVVVDVRDAPDRPGREHVVIARSVAAVPSGTAQGGPAQGAPA